MVARLLPNGTLFGATGNRLVWKEINRVLFPVENIRAFFFDKRMLKFSKCATELSLESSSNSQYFIFYGMPEDIEQRREELKKELFELVYPKLSNLKNPNIDHELRLLSYFTLSMCNHQPNDKETILCTKISVSSFTENEESERDFFISYYKKLGILSDNYDYKNCEREITVSLGEKYLEDIAIKIEAYCLLLGLDNFNCEMKKENNTNLPYLDLDSLSIYYHSADFAHIVAFLDFDFNFRLKLVKDYSDIIMSYNNYCFIVLIKQAARISQLVGEIQTHG